MSIFMPIVFVLLQLLQESQSFGPAAKKTITVFICIYGRPSVVQTPVFTYSPL